MKHSGLEQAKVKLRYIAPDHPHDLHQFFVMLQTDDRLNYRLNTQGEGSLPVCTLYGWAVQNLVGGWSRNASSFFFENPDDAMAFKMRWDGATIEFLAD
jgi:hypothetical protein